MFYLSDRISKIMFFASLVFLVALLAFAYGILVGSGRAWPHQTLRILIEHLRSAYIAGEWQPGGRFVQAPAGRRGNAWASTDLNCSRPAIA